MARVYLAVFFDGLIKVRRKNSLTTGSNVGTRTSE